MLYVHKNTLKNNYIFFENHLTEICLKCYIFVLIKLFKYVVLKSVQYEIFLNLTENIFLNKIFYHHPLNEYDND